MLETCKRRKRLSMTPLIDIIFLLLLFFMLSSTFTRFGEVTLFAGGASGGDGSDVPPLFLRVSQSGLSQPGLSLNGAPTDIFTLPRAIDAARQTDAGQPVLVSLATDVTAQRLTDILVLLHNVDGLSIAVLDSR